MNFAAVIINQPLRKGFSIWEIELVSSSTIRNSSRPPYTCTGTASPFRHGWTQLKHLMNGRFDDADYAAARFVGICHQQIEGNLSLGRFVQQVHPSRTSTTNR